MLKKLLVSLLSALLCISVVAEPEIQSNGNQNETDVKIDEKGHVFVAPLWYHISSDSTAEVIWDYSSYKKLESVVIPSEIRVDGHVYSVTIIGEKAFGGCSGLTSIEIPSSVTSIGNEAFSFCSGLTSIEIPSSVTSIRNSAFSCCAGLTNINVATDNQIYTSENGVLYNKDKTELICVPNGKKGKIKIPSSVTSIESWAFSECSGLSRVKIPSSVTSIEWGAFTGCSGLTNIKIPSGVTSIEYGTFSGCSGLTSIEIPSSVTSIGDYAFYGCGELRSIEIPSSVTIIGYVAFKDCSGLTEIYIPSSVTYIEDWAFQNCKNLDVIIDNSEENVTVGRSAFLGCKSVKFLK